MMIHNARDNISENSAQHTDALALAEQMLFYWYFWLPGSTAEERAASSDAHCTLQHLINKERSVPIGTGLERLTELAKGMHSGYIVFTSVPLADNLLQIDFFHTIRREIVGWLVLEEMEGYYCIHHMELDAF